MMCVQFQEDWKGGNQNALM